MWHDGTLAKLATGRTAGFPEGERWVVERVDAPAFGVLRRRYRDEARLTQEQFAKRTGLALLAIGLPERGARRQPQSYTVQELAEAFALVPELCPQILGYGALTVESERQMLEGVVVLFARSSCEGLHPAGTADIRKLTIARRIATGCSERETSAKYGARRRPRDKARALPPKPLPGYPAHTDCGTVGFARGACRAEPAEVFPRKKPDEAAAHCRGQFGRRRDQQHAQAYGKLR